MTPLVDGNGVAVEPSKPPYPADFCPFSAFPLRRHVPSASPSPACPPNPLAGSLLAAPLFTHGSIGPDSASQDTKSALPRLQPLTTLALAAPPQDMGQTPERATEPTPTSPLRQMLQGPQAKTSAKEDTWRDGLRAGFLSFSSSM